MSDLIPQDVRAQWESALQDVFDTYKRGFVLYVDAGVGTINTDPNFAGMFGDNSQNNTAVINVPQSYLLSGCILYGNKQPWEYIEPATRANYQQDHIRESFGTVRIKVDATGYSLMKDCKEINLDGFLFKLNSNARPHGLLTPQRYTFTLIKQD